MAPVIEVRRDGDNELCGYVTEEAGGWLASSMFGGRLCRRGSYDEAVQAVLSDGLASLASHWMLSGPDIEGEQIVCIQNASPQTVTVALDYYSMPGVPTVTLSRADLEAGVWRLRLPEQE
jgi:hypothetical protein